MKWKFVFPIVIIFILVVGGLVLYKPELFRNLPIFKNLLPGVVSAVNTVNIAQIFPDGPGVANNFTYIINGTAGWQIVDESPANDSDYVSSNTSTQNETFSLGNVTIPPNANITNITVYIRASASSNITRNQSSIFIISGATAANGTTKTNASVANKTAAFVSYSANWTLNPAGGGSIWNQTTINALQAGVRLPITKFGGVSVSQLYVNVTYITDTTNPTVTLNDPADAYSVESSTIAFNATGSDDLNLSNMTVYGNWSGNWAANLTNSTPPVNNTLTTLIVTGIQPGTYVWNVLVCDKADNCVFAASNRTLTILSPDIISPTYSNNQVNNTVAGQATNFSLLVNDDRALQTNGQYIFSTNNTGTWANDTAPGTISYTNTSNSTNASTNQQFNFTNVQSSLTNGYVIAGIATLCSAGDNISTITYDGTNMVFLNRIASVASSNAQVELWGLAVGSKGSGTYFVNITFTAGCGGSGAATLAGISAFSGINQTVSNGTTVLNDGTAAGTQATVNVTTVVGDIVYDVLFPSSSDVPVVGAGQVELYSNFEGTSSEQSEGSWENATTTTTNMSWTGLTSTSYIMAAVPLKVAATGNYFIATPQAINATALLNSTVSTVVGYRWYLTDNEGNKNTTDIFTVTTTSGGGGNCWATIGRTIYVPAGCSYYIQGGTSSYTG